MKRIPSDIWYTVVIFLERGIALFVLFSVVLYISFSIPVLVVLDWGETSTFYELIYRVLIAIIGLELVRMLITHSIAAVLELLAFVIARKMLKPELTSIDILFSVLSFVALMAARHYFTEQSFDCMEESNHPSS